jgi:hypothetical protein
MLIVRLELMSLSLPATPEMLGWRYPAIEVSISISFQLTELSGLSAAKSPNIFGTLQQKRVQPLVHDLLTLFMQTLHLHTRFVGL